MPAKMGLIKLVEIPYHYETGVGTTVFSFNDRRQYVFTFMNDLIHDSTCNQFSQLKTFLGVVIHEGAVF
jgi:hypothetical protein